MAPNAAAPARSIYPMNLMAKLKVSSDSMIVPRRGLIFATARKQT